MLIGNLDKFGDIRLLGRDRAVHIGEKVRCCLARRHGNHLPAALAETEPVRRSGRQMHQRARYGDHVVGIDAERDIALYHVEGFIPGAAVRRRPAAFGTGLAKNLITAGLCTRRENRDFLADDI
jgi:hypothetical protein